LDRTQGWLVSFRSRGEVVGRAGYYFSRLRELGLREGLEQARSLATAKTATVLHKTYDRYFRRDVTEADILRISGFKTRQDCASHFRSRSLPVLSVFDKTADDFRRRFPQQAAELIATAENILSHRIDLLGSGLIDLNRINSESVIQADGSLVHNKMRLGYLPWHTDFKSGVSWNPSTYYKEARYGHLSGVDVKVPWELSRSHHLLTLGQAYYLTGNNTFCEEFIRQIADWIERNPCRYGINWACTMDVGIRAVNWIWAFFFFRESPVITDEFVLRFLASLYAHAAFIRSNLEFRVAWIDGVRRRLNSNHYLSDIVGLLYIAVIFPEFHLSEDVLFATGELETELFEETTPDGVDYEHSTSYHRLVLELFLSAFNLLRLNGSTIGKAAEERLIKMAEFVADYSRTDGSAPQIGDGDNGRLHPLSIRPANDHSYIPIVAATLFSSKTLQSARPDPEGWWWCGSSNDDSTPARSSRGYTDAGFYIMRSAAANIFICAAEVGMRGLGSHSHNDHLSFEYWADGHAWVVDPGTYLYTPNPEARNYFRSTAAHNTVRIDGLEINPFDSNSLFQMSNSARITIRKWETAEDHDELEAEHTGYRRLDRGVTHRRRFSFEKSSEQLVIEDSFEGSGIHKFEWFFHLGPDVAAWQEESVFEMEAGGQRLSLRFDGAELTFEISEGWYSPSYGIRQPNQVIIARTETTAPSVRVVIEPRKTKRREC
jgi:hypothetical protein